MNIICVKIGTKYPAELVNRLYRMCRKNISTPFNFFCYTDIEEGVDSNVKIIPFVSHNLDVIVYNKLFMFSKQFAQSIPEGTCVYFDLDIVIKSNIDDIVNYNNKDLTVIRSSWRKEHPRGFPVHHHYINSSCMTWIPSNTEWIWKHFISDPEFFMTKYHWGMDSFLSYEFEHANKKLHTFPEMKFYSHLYGVNHLKNFELDPPNTQEEDRGGYRPSKWVEVIKTIPIVLFNGPTTLKDYEQFTEYYSD